MGSTYLVHVNYVRSIERSVKELIVNLRTVL